MDMISQLSDDLLLRILSLVPTKDVIATSCVSKKWLSLCSLVSRLEYDDSHYHKYDDADYKSFTQFVYRSLMLNKAPVLDKLHLNFGPRCHPIDIKIWIDTAIAHRVRELYVKIRSGRKSPVNLPSSLYTCETLKTMTLINCQVLDVLRLSSLWMLSLMDVEYTSLPKLISGCPNLKILGVIVKEEEEGEEEEGEEEEGEEYEGEEDKGEVEDHNITVISVPCLRILYLNDARNESKGGVHVIEAPCLKYLKIVDDVVYDSRRIENMPNLTEAHVDITQGVTHKFLRALASARRLYLCVPLLSEVSRMSIYFYRLVHLELSTCAQGWWELLSQMLQNSPKLASLKLTNEYELAFPSKETPDCWKRPSCISDNLESFAWSEYKGRRGDLEMATFIIKNATRLKTATFLPQCNDFEAKYKMLKDLISVAMPSASCRLLFG